MKIALLIVTSVLIGVLAGYYFSISLSSSFVGRIVLPKL